MTHSANTVSSPILPPSPSAGDRHSVPLSAALAYSVVMSPRTIAAADLGDLAVGCLAPPAVPTIDETDPLVADYCELTTGRLLTGTRALAVALIQSALRTVGVK